MKQYAPKGSMCIVCKNINQDCSKLDFKSMPIMKKHADINIVKCNGVDKK